MWTSSFIGTSTHANEPEVIKATVDAGIWDVVLTSYNFVQEHREDVKKAIAYAVSKGGRCGGHERPGNGRHPLRPVP